MKGCIYNVSNKFKRCYITSPYGKRNVISTSSGNTSSFHYGVDYGTNGKKIAQYAIEDGTIISCGKDSAANGYALFVWVSYPRINKKFLHYHLDSISVKKGQTVKKGTLIGYTGKTGKATGIHLHLGVKDLTTGKYEDPEAFSKSYKVPAATSTNKTSFLPSRGYFRKGDKSKNVGKIASFMRKTFPDYTSAAALGNLYGDNLIKSIKEFQKRTGLEADGCTGAKTLAMLKKYGFTE